MMGKRPLSKAASGCHGGHFWTLRSGSAQSLHSAGGLFVIFLLWPRGISAAFLMAIVTLFRWLAAFAARLATAHGHADRKATRPTGGD